MSSDAAVALEGIGKSYELGGASRSAREALASALRPARPDRLWWALRDVSFEVRRGERIAIIGRNGAGKSTLLRILARITAPSAGRARVRGRLASLLEVGTGFHPELSGRENIRLNGAIMGMGRVEVARRFDEIVAFADVGPFLDEPVKRYSSGMQMRLAFAVAAHLEPDVIAVDEVLAVGDAAFQRKCLGKMGQAAREGRTVLFVSHSMTAVAAICERAVLLEGGRVTAQGASAEVIARYLGAGAAAGAATVELAERSDRSGNGAIRFRSIAYTTAADEPRTALPCGGDARLVLRFGRDAGRSLHGLVVAVGIDNARGERVAHLSSEVCGAPADVPSDAAAAIIDIPRLPLMPGAYRLTLFASVGGEIADWMHDAATLVVEGGDPFGSGRLPSEGQGDVLVPHALRWAAT